MTSFIYITTGIILGIAVGICIAVWIKMKQGQQYDKASCFHEFSEVDMANPDIDPQCSMCGEVMSNLEKRVLRDHEKDQL